MKMMFGGAARAAADTRAQTHSAVVQRMQSDMIAPQSLPAALAFRLPPFLPLAFAGGLGALGSRFVGIGAATDSRHATSLPCSSLVFSGCEAARSFFWLRSSLRLYSSSRPSSKNSTSL